MTSSTIKTPNFNSWSEQEIMRRLGEGVNSVFKAKSFEELKKQYRTLRSLWHPDHKKVEDEKKANAIFQKLQLAFEEAEQLLTAGKAVGVREIALETSTSRYMVSYLRETQFELGKVYVGKKHLTYVIEGDYEKLFMRAKEVIQKIKYASTDMERQFSKTVPHISHTFKTLQNQWVMVIDKKETFLNLADTQVHLGGKIDPRHTAWILSNLYNLSCFLEYNGLSHNAILPQNIYIEPHTHEVALLGGWWYSAFYEEPLLALHYDAAPLCSLVAKNKKKPDALLDQKLIAQTGMELLGSRIYSVLKRNADIPAPLTQWLGSSGNLSGVKNYAVWQKEILANSFGKRKFIVLDIKPQELYPDYHT